MLSCKLQGGLGNQLFQIFFLITFATDHEALWYLVPYEKIGNRPSYWSTIFKNCQPMFKPMYLYPGKTLYEQHLFRIPPQIMVDFIKYTNPVVGGYFQDYRFFHHRYNEITNFLGLPAMRQNITNTYKYPYSKTTSIHFRYGDYKSFPDHYNILQYEYYHNALLYILQSEPPISLTSTILIFYELSDYVDVSEIIDRLSACPVFSRLTFTYIDVNIPDWVQLLIMSNCKNNVIANSTFSWWGAYINSSESKIVCYPTVWYKQKLEHINVDVLHVPTWTAISDT
jgi:hypothetical protein